MDSFVFKLNTTLDTHIQPNSGCDEVAILTASTIKPVLLAAQTVSESTDFNFVDYAEVQRELAFTSKVYRSQKPLFCPISLNSVQN